MCVISTSWLQLQIFPSQLELFFRICQNRRSTIRAVILSGVIGTAMNHKAGLPFAYAVLGRAVAFPLAIGNVNIHVDQHVTDFRHL
jgi:hypothetical protein